MEDFLATQRLENQYTTTLLCNQTIYLSESMQTPVRSLQRPPRLQDDKMETHRRWRTSWLHRDLKINIQQHQYVTRPFIMSESMQTPVRNLQRPPRLHDDKMETHRRWRTSWLHRDLKINTHPHQNVTRPFNITSVRNLQRPPRLQDDKMETHRRWRTSWLHRDLKINIHPHYDVTRPCIMSHLTQSPLRNLHRY